VLCELLVRQTTVSLILNKEGCLMKLQTKWTGANVCCTKLLIDTSSTTHEVCRIERELAVITDLATGLC